MIVFRSTRLPAYRPACHSLVFGHTRKQTMYRRGCSQESEQRGKHTQVQRWNEKLVSRHLIAKERESQLPYVNVTVTQEIKRGWCSPLALMTAAVIDKQFSAAALFALPNIPGCLSCPRITYQLCTTQSNCTIAHLERFCSTLDSLASAGRRMSTSSRNRRTSFSKGSKTSAWFNMEAWCGRWRQINNTSTLQT